MSSHVWGRRKNSTFQQGLGGGTCTKPRLLSHLCSLFRWLLTAISSGWNLSKLVAFTTFLYTQGSSGWSNNLIDRRQISKRKQPNLIRTCVWEPRGHESQRQKGTWVSRTSWAQEEAKCPGGFEGSLQDKNRDLVNRSLLHPIHRSKGVISDDSLLWPRWLREKQKFLLSL